ncbi:DUF4381 domain-containing protein [Xanthomonas sp. AmX2]|uniref:DUF4381 domain-containing protein n=1 Tax=Xanthomonas sp. TaxID=29446 RepID=UPI001981BCF2|nr:DUF4381 domain-containing protein [Xanthomonas sp.]MBN6152315.1 DUF4381 domain-containing protein [Xanthomonas sp.]
MTPEQLPLRDVHLPPAPGWWPPAPGWWLLAAFVLALLGAALGVWAWRRMRRRRWRQRFDRALAGGDAPAQVAAMSELLRRAARRGAPDAATLQGEAWLQFLDGGKGHAFSEGHGRLLLDGGYRRELDPAAVQGLAEVARVRFVELMAGRR